MQQRQQQRDKVWCVAVSQLSMAADWIQTSPGCDINRREGRVQGEVVVVRSVTAVKILHYK